jgi:hypothetical protein
LAAWLASEGVPGGKREATGTMGCGMPAIYMNLQIQSNKSCFNDPLFVELAIGGRYQSEDDMRQGFVWSVAK